VRTYRVHFHPQALEEHPELGEQLGNKAGLDLTGYRKLYADQKRVRLVYRWNDGDVIVFVVAIGKREDLGVYRSASNRT